MKTAVFSAKSYDRLFLEEANEGRLKLTFYEARLDETTCRLAYDFPAVCVFVNDRLNWEVLRVLFSGKTRMIALRCSGFNNVDFYSVKHLGMVVARVPAYSPNSISEYAIGLMIALARKICKAYIRTKTGNFALQGLLGHNLSGRTCGVIGTGQIGALVAKGLLGLGCHVIASDVIENPELLQLGIHYYSRDELLRKADIISLHCPLTPETRHLINAETIQTMRQAVMIVNTARGGLIDPRAAIDGLKSGQIGAMAMDVYEGEEGIFFEDHSNRIIEDDVLARLLSFPNVILTGHQAFFTVEAIRNIARQTIDNILAWRNGGTPPGLVTPEASVVDEKPEAVLI